MIRKLAVSGAVAALVAAGAPASQAQPGPPPAAAGAAMPTPDYIHAAATTDEYEIAAARMALTRAHNPHVIRFARKMIHDHTESTRMIRRAIAMSGHRVPPPPPLTGQQQHMLDDLRAARGDFGRVYIDQQVQAHQMALGVHQAYASGGSDPALRRTAAKIVPVVQMHLQMARELQRRMG